MAGALGKSEQQSRRLQNVGQSCVAIREWLIRTIETPVPPNSQLSSLPSKEPDNLQPVVAAPTDGGEITAGKGRDKRIERGRDCEAKEHKKREANLRRELGIWRRGCGWYGSWWF